VLVTNTQAAVAFLSIFTKIMSVTVWHYLETTGLFTYISNSRQSDTAVTTTHTALTLTKGFHLHHIPTKNCQTHGGEISIFRILSPLERELNFQQI